MQQYQRLSWEQKTAIIKNLASDRLQVGTPRQDESTQPVNVSEKAVKPIPEHKASASETETETEALGSSAFSDRKGMIKEIKTIDDVSGLSFDSEQLKDAQSADDDEKDPEPGLGGEKSDM